MCVCTSRGSGARRLNHYTIITHTYTRIRNINRNKWQWRRRWRRFVPTEFDRENGGKIIETRLLFFSFYLFTLIRLLLLLSVLSSSMSGFFFFVVCRYRVVPTPLVVTRVITRAQLIPTYLPPTRTLDYLRVPCITSRIYMYNWDRVLMREIHVSRISVRFYYCIHIYSYNVSNRRRTCGIIVSSRFMIIALSGRRTDYIIFRVEWYIERKKMYSRYFFSWCI